MKWVKLKNDEIKLLNKIIRCYEFDDWQNKTQQKKEARLLQQIENKF